MTRLFVSILGYLDQIRVLNLMVKCWNILVGRGAEKVNASVDGNKCSH